MSHRPPIGRSLPPSLRVLAFVILWGCILAATVEARIPQTETCVRPQDEIWVVSTREMGSLPRRKFVCNPKFTYEQFGCKCGWVTKSPCCFQETFDPCARTVIYVHGNRMTPEWTKRRGLDLYNALKCCADDRPIRLVIWSWPSSPIPRRLAIARDARVKLRRTPLQSYYLGWWMHHCCQDCRVSMVGYSYGARTILGALHLLGGGSIAGRALPTCNCESRPKVRMSLWAAASQSDWLLPGRPHGRALTCVERGVIFYNRMDPALKRFPRFACSVTGPALGYLGLTNPNCGPSAYSRLCQYNVTNQIGRLHSWDRYRHCRWIMNTTCNMALDWPCRSLIEQQQIYLRRVSLITPLVARFH